MELFPIRLTDGKYSASKCGGIFSNISGRFLTPSIHPGGYHTVMFSVKERKPKRLYVHALIADTFIGVRPHGHEVDHINRIKTDNRPENLRYVFHFKNQHNHIKHQVKRTNMPRTVFKGVHYLTSGVINKWRAAITINRKMTIIGRFATDIEAAIAWDEVAVRERGIATTTNRSLGLLP